MLNVYTSVLTRRVPVTGTHHTLPYEAGWASEAIVFVQAEGPHPELTVHVEVSPDGIHWIARPAAATISAESSLAELPVSHFGNWLRVVVTGASDAEPARLLIHLAAKG